MAVSANGWLANNRSVIVSFPLPGGSVALRRGSPGEVLCHVGRRWNNEVEPLVWPGCWGYAERPIRGGVQLSNHASGTALDLCAPKHPLGTNPSSNFSAAGIAKIHEIMVECQGVVRWGGDYIGRKDGMHVEINDGVSEARVDQLWAFLVAKYRGGGGQPDQPWLNLADVRTKPRQFQQWYNGFPFNPPLLPMISPLADSFGPQSLDALKKIQARFGLVPDGIVGPQTKHVLWNLGWRG